MRDGLKNRIKFNPENPSRANLIKHYPSSKMTFNKRKANGNCISNVCIKNTAQPSRKYYAPFRQPVKGYRRETNNAKAGSNGYNNIDNPNCFTTTEIYKDS